MRRNWSRRWLQRDQRRRLRHQATHGAMRRHWSTLADKLTEVDEESEGDTRGEAQALLDTVAHSLAKVDVETVGDEVSYA